MSELSRKVFLAETAALRERIADALRTLTAIGDVPPRQVVPVLDVSNPRMARIADWQPLDDLIDAVLAVLPAPGNQTTDRAAEIERLRKEHATWRKHGKRNLEAAHEENARLRADHAASLDRFREVTRRLAAHAAGFRDVLDESDRGAWGKTVAADIAELRRLADETPAVAEAAAPHTDDTQAASSAPLAAGFPLVKGNCPACRHASLFLGTGGYPTCSNPDCTEPDAATTVLEQYGHEAHAPEHTWSAEMYDPLADEWVPGTRYIARDRAVNHLNHANAIGPTWKDGTPVQRRLVRATTTYTVEAEHTAEARQDEEADRG